MPERDDVENTGHEDLISQGSISNIPTTLPQPSNDHATVPSPESASREPTNDRTDSVKQPIVVNQGPSSASLFLSTLLSLGVILVLLVALRFLLPSMVEFARYSWHRGQLRAEYDVAGTQLERVSWDGLTSVSRLVAKRVCPSVVQVTVANHRDSERSGDSESIKSGQGSGVIVDPRGYILTNHHVLTDDFNKISGEINVVLPDQRKLVATLVGSDNLTDLAVLHIDADDLFPIAWGDSEEVETGSPVWAVGSPFGLAGSITFGIISSKHRLDLAGTTYRRRDPALTRGTFHSDLNPKYSDLMQTDVAVNPGNSGGPLVNGKGELIGINTAIIGESYQGVSFAIPSSTARVVFEQILESGKMRHGWLGVELIHPRAWERNKPGAEMGDEINTRTLVGGAVIRSVVGSRSPAAKAGLAVGDHVLAINEEQVNSVDQLIHRISRSPVGSQLVLSIERQGEPQKITVVVGERPNFMPQ